MQLHRDIEFIAYLYSWCMFLPCRPRYRQYSNIINRQNTNLAAKMLISLTYGASIRSCGLGRRAPGKLNISAYRRKIKVNGQLEIFFIVNSQATISL